MRAVPLGFGERHALVFELGLPAQRYPSWGDAKRFSDRLRERLAEVPGVRSVGQIAQCLPLVGYMCFGDVLEAEGKPVPQGTVPPVIGVRAAGVDYFRAMDIPVRGRVFTRADQTDSGSVAILSEAGARAYFPGQDPIGRRVRFSGARHGTQWYTIVGVARDVRVRIETDDFKRLIYLPIVPREANGPSSAKMMWVLATGMPPLSIAPVVRQVVEEADPGLPLARLGTLRDLINDATAPTAFALTLVALAAVIALLLGAVGVYAVIAYAVSRRTAEIGVRLALGARAADVRWMVVRQGGAVVIAGIVAGLAGALVLTRTLRAMLFGVSPTDVASYAVQTMVMLGVALLALYLPARRAAGVDPMEALRAD
jgi:predicted permease